MANDNAGRGNRQTTKRIRHIWLIPVGVALLAVIAGFLWAAGVFGNRRSADERLAEIEAARAIPDSENAASIYNELLQDPNAGSVLDDFPESPAGDVLGRVLREPWFSRDLPELADWVKERQYISGRLLEASRLENCRFPISIDITDTSEVDRASRVRQWGFLLSIAANNDLAEGRFEVARMRWRCLLRMASHLHQQPMQTDHLTASAAGRLALERMARFVVTGDATESHLREIEAMELPMKDNWQEHCKTIRLVEDLRSQKMMEPFGPVGRLKYHVVSFRMRRVVESATGEPLDKSSLEAKIVNQYLRSTATARGVRILIALRRYRNTAGRWPGSLDEIRPSLSEEILTDPLSKGPFVYKPSGDTFTLYSKGENNIAEDGRHKSDGPDDWPIWPPRGRMVKAEQKDVNEP